MKLVQGKRLDEHVATVPALSDRLRIFLRICDAVAFAHALCVLHRDLKPGNVMVGPYGEVLVMDWGLSKLMAENGSEMRVPGTAARGGSATLSNENTAHGTVLGTPGYMAPEQRGGKRSTSARMSTRWGPFCSFFWWTRHRSHER